MFICCVVVSLFSSWTLQGIQTESTFCVPHQLGFADTAWKAEGYPSLWPLDPSLWLDAPQKLLTTKVKMAAMTPFNNYNFLMLFLSLQVLGLYS